MPQRTMISEVQTASQKEHVQVCKFDGHVGNVNCGLFNHDDEHLKRSKEHFTTVLNRITFGEVPPPVDEMASHFQK